MRPFLAALLCLSGVPPLAAAPAISLYGKLYAEHGSEEAAGTSFTTLDDAQSTGRLGVRFSQSLGDGLTAFGLYEWGMQATDTAGNFVLREGFVGLRGAFGSLAMGRFAGAFKTTAGITWDGFQFTGLTPIGQGGLAGGAFGDQSFVSRLIEYRTPRLGNPEGVYFDALVQYGGDDSPTTTTARGSALGGATLGWRGWEVALAAAGDKATGAENHKVGLRWQGERLTTGVVYEAVESGGYDPGGAGAFVLGHLHWRQGDTLWMVQGGRYASDLPGADARYLAVGLRHLFAANVWGIAGFRDTASDLAALDTRALVLGLRLDFDHRL